MQLYFVRHGSAVEPEDWRGAEPERPLTAEGRDELRRVARGLAELGVLSNAIYTSPYARARETAEIIGAALGLAATPAAELAPGCDLDSLAALLTAASRLRQLESVMVVGHEPDLSEMIGQIIGWNGHARVEMKKASCARVDISLAAISAQQLAGRGTLAWLLRAKHLAHLSG